jgi:GMP synthase-like glutamine amidotransferase
MRWNTFEIVCYGERLLLRQYKGETTKETLIREFGWLLKPIMEQNKSFEKSLDKLNWKIEKKY